MPNILHPSRTAEWVVYAKAPFGGPEQVLEYLGRYTHRVAISNNRLLDFSRWRSHLCLEGLSPRVTRKDHALDAQEFIRRFLLHVLPSGFQRIRHYGFLANRYREVKLEQCRQVAGGTSARGGGGCARSSSWITVTATSA